jgi:two-component system phosphate regulon sensor histidine kinase PhoR
LTQQHLDLCASLLAGLREPALLCAPDGKILSANSALLHLLPTARQGSQLAFCLRAPEVLDAVQSVLKDGAMRSARWHERVPVEQIFDIVLAGVPVPDVGTCVLISFHDLTSAQRVEKMREDFVANVSHELRTPLASLLGFVETLQGPAREDPAARQRFLDIMLQQAQRMSRLIDDLLSLSRIEQKEHLRPTNSVDLTGVVEQVCDSLSTIARDHRVTLQRDLPPQCFISGDRDELIRLTENLIENAIKYGSLPDQDSDVEITLQQTGGQTILTIRDHGAGIAREHLPRLTERFYRANAGESRAKGGTGLGLALVKHIAMRHRGRLEIASTPGEGASFSVIF